MRSTQLHQLVQEACHQKIKHSPALNPPSALSKVSTYKLFCHHSRSSRHEACKACILPLLDNPWEFPFSAPGTPISLCLIMMYITSCH